MKTLLKIAVIFDVKSFRTVNKESKHRKLNLNTLPTNKRSLLLPSWRIFKVVAKYYFLGDYWSLYSVNIQFRNLRAFEKWKYIYIYIYLFIKVNIKHQNKSKGNTIHGVHAHYIIFYSSVDSALQQTFFFLFLQQTLFFSCFCIYCTHFLCPWEMGNAYWLAYNRWVVIAKNYC